MKNAVLVLRFPRFESYRRINQPRPEERAVARVSKDGHKRDRASGHPSRRRYAPPSTKPNPAWALAQAGSPRAASRGSGFNQFLRRQAPQKTVNWFHPQWVGPIRWGTQDEVCGFKLHPLDPIGFHEIDLLGTIDGHVPREFGEQRRAPHPVVR